MLPRKIGHPRPQHAALAPEILAVILGLVLVAGLLVAMFAGPALAPGTLLVGADGCAARVWRNPVTGRDEAIGATRLGRDGAPLCR